MTNTTPNRAFTNRFVYLIEAVGIALLVVAILLAFGLSNSQSKLNTAHKQIESQQATISQVTKDRDLLVKNEKKYIKLAEKCGISSADWKRALGDLADYISNYPNGDESEYANALTEIQNAKAAGCPTDPDLSSTGATS